MNSYFQRSTSAAPLAVFRIAFGVMLFISILRFWSKGWIETLYIKPTYFFSYYGFEFIHAPGTFIYFIFGLCGIAALLVAFGAFYRISSTLLFLSFTYIELIDKSTYLNHYYFISLVSLMMVFLPAHVYFSFDAWKNKKLNADRVPQWTTDSIKLMVGILYFYAGLAKLNSDWLLHALPLKIWLPARNDMPIIGPLFNYDWIPYFFSWFGCLYDLSIPFLLLNRLTRSWAYITVVVFHILTWLLFPIGMFPHIMIVAALIFFSSEFHERIILAIGRIFRIQGTVMRPRKLFVYHSMTQYLLIIFFMVFFLIQLLLPFRYMAYPGELFWTEEGYRFSWRVMLIEKAGYAQFTIKDTTGKHVVVNNNEFLTPLQEKMMSTQPDMILQYAHMLHDHYSKSGFSNPQVYVDSYVALNGRRGTVLINPETDLAKEKESFKHKSWILPFHDKIQGL